jgi:hypothetical protein
MLERRRHRWSSTCRTWAPASTPTSTRWPTASARPRGTASASSSATGRTRSAATAVEGPAAPGVRVVRGTVPDSAAARADHRGDRAALQRGVRHRRGARRDAARRVAPRRYFDETGLPWVIPSPNLPTLDSAIVYPGTVLFEGTLLSEGRGTTRPVRAGGRALDRRRAAGGRDERARPAGRALPAGVLRADLPEARANHVRRLPGARDRPPASSPVRTAVEVLAECRARRRRRSLAPAALRVRARPVADRHPRGSDATHRSGGGSTVADVPAARSRRSGQREKYLRSG